MQEFNINLLSVAGHKGLYAPQGIGALLINNCKVDWNNQALMYLEYRFTAKEFYKLLKTIVFATNEKEYSFVNRLFLLT